MCRIRFMVKLMKSEIQGTSLSSSLFQNPMRDPSNFAVMFINGLPKCRSFRFCKTGTSDEIPRSFCSSCFSDFLFLQSFSSALPGKGMQQLEDLIMRKKVPGELGGKLDHLVPGVSTRMFYFKDYYCPRIVILNDRQSPPPARDIWQCLQTFSVVIGGLGWGGQPLESS